MARLHPLVPLAAACVLLAPPRARAAEAKMFQVDGVHSSVLFRIKHLNTSYTWGRFNAVSGTVDLDGPNAAVDVQVQAGSVDTGNAKRDQHIRGPDFLGAKQFPTISFTSSKIAQVDDATYDVEGTLTLHGVSRPIHVQIERTGPNPGLTGGTITGLVTEFTIQRSDYGMKFALAGASDEVLLIVSLECAAK